MPPEGSSPPTLNLEGAARILHRRSADPTDGRMPFNIWFWKNFKTKHEIKIILVQTGMRAPGHPLDLPMHYSGESKIWQREYINILIDNMIAENCMEMKEIGPRGRSSPRPGPPMLSTTAWNILDPPVNDSTCWQWVANGTRIKLACVLSLGYVFINCKNNRGIWFT